MRPMRWVCAKPEKKKNCPATRRGRKNATRLRRAIAIVVLTAA
jgi:hypothetical protein